MPSIIHFEIRVGDVERAVRFYTEIFGWRIERWAGPEGSPEYYSITTGKEGGLGIGGGLMRREGPDPKGKEPIRSFVCTIGVESADECADKIRKSGGKITTPKMPIAGIGWMLYAEDTEGNLFGIMQDDKNAR